MPDFTYRDFRISEVCGFPFAAKGPPESALHLSPIPPHTGVAGLVRAIDAYWFDQSVATCEALLESRRAHLADGTWDMVKCEPKGEPAK